MNARHDAMLLVRADLCERLEAVRALGGRRPTGMEAQLRGIRDLAAAYGLVPVVRIAEAWSRADHCAPQGAAATLYLERLEDAIGCARVDDATAETLLASVSVRLSA